MSATTLQVAADIGGTFTDIVFQYGDGRLDKRKVQTTPDDFGRAIVEGVIAYLVEKGITVGEVSEILHATTVATNAILERRGAKTALVTTEGFRDVLELRRIRIPFSYDLSWAKPEPMAERAHRYEAVERIAADGAVLTPLDLASLEPALADIAASGIESVAVCCLHAYREPSHEKAIGDTIRKAFPDLPVSLSHEILPEVREFERTSTTVVNAYVAPLVGRYLDALRARFHAAGIKAPILVMQSAGGLISAGAAARNAVTIIESGPAAGVVAAARIARLGGHPNVITLDMGGTTTKASIIEEDEMLRASEYEVGSEISVSSRLVRGSGYLLKIPVIDISEVGAGGGSIARVDDAGALRVGPRSASSVPGPACYGKGNDRPTVTDANLALGYLAAGSLAGGSLSIDVDLARKALDMHVGAQTRLATLEAAWGVYLIANSNMVRAIKTVSVERGRDPADFTMMAFGGAGPLHAAAVARELGIRRVLIPPSPGVFSAFGLLGAPVEQHGARSVLCSTKVIDKQRIADTFAQLRADIAARLAGEGYAVEEVNFSARADLRYHGQSAELTVPFDDTRIDADSLAELEKAFEGEYERTFGHRGGTRAFDFVTARVVGGVRRSEPGRITWETDPGSNHSGGARHAYFGAEQGLVETPVIARNLLSKDRTPGPLLVQEYDTTIVVPPGFAAALDPQGCVIIDVPPR
ncbi:MAG: hydantoinase/oxoprolinase family protein [Rhizobiaceae bacterium]